MSSIEERVEQLADLYESMSAELRDLHRERLVQRRRRLEAILGHPVGTRVGQLLAPDALRVGQDDIARTYGNLDPLQAKNALGNPVMDQVGRGGPYVIGTSNTNIGLYWRARYILNSGTAPAEVRVDEHQHRDLLSDLHSDAPVILTTGTASAYDLDVLIESETGFDSSSWAHQFPFLVASARIGVHAAFQSAFTTVRARMELVNETDATTATSEWVDLLALYATKPAQYGFARITAFASVLGLSKVWRFRIRINAVKNATANQPLSNVLFAEPQLNATYTQDPPLYSPLLDMWHPQLVLGTDPGDSNARMLLDTDGLQMGPGNASMDVSFARTGANQWGLGSDDRLVHALHGCTLVKTTDQNVADTTWAAIGFADAEGTGADPFGMHSTVTNNTRITVPAGWPTSIWRAHGSISWLNHVTAGTRRSIGFALNGAATPSTVNTGDLLDSGSFPDLGITHELTRRFRLAAGEYVELKGFQNRGAALDVTDATFSLEFIGLAE